jgi:iron complex outermembrane receptor protein
LLSVITLVLGIVVSAAQARGAIRGLITDPSGAAVQQAKITVTDPAGLIFGTVADSFGRFTVETAAPGKYVVLVTAESFSPKRIETEVRESSSTIELRITMEIAPVSQSVEVAGEIEYVVTESPAVTKLDTPLRDLPQSVQIITREVLNDQAVVTLPEAAKNVAGVSGAFGFMGTMNGCLRVRGFSTEQGSVGCTYYQDGVRLWAQPLSVASIESLEVVKGPNTVLFGRNEPGGMVNVTPKRPRPGRMLSLQQTGDTFGGSITSLDMGGGLIGDNKLLSRVNLAYYHLNDFRDRAFDHLLNATAALAWRVSEGTQFDLSADYTRDVYQPDFGLPALGDRPAPVPITLSYKQDYIDSRTESQIYRAGLAHAFSPAWRLNVRGFYSWMKPNYFNVYGYGLNEETLQYGVFHFAEQFSWRRGRQVVGDLTGEFKTGPITHQILLGTDYFNERYDGPIFFSDVSPPLDLYAPQIGSAVQLFPTRDEYSPWGSITRWSGFYAQDQITLSSKWLVNIGFRHDRTKGAFSPNPIEDAVRENATKPRLGVVYHAWPSVSFYTQYQEAFGPNNGRSSTSEPFPGQTAKQIESGVKWTPFGGRFLATLAMFDLRKERLLTADLTTPDPFDRIAIGEVRNRGVEIDASGRITERLSAIGSFAYSDTKIMRDNNGYEGNRYQGVPRFQGSIWARYDIGAGWSAGFGVFSEDDRPGDLGNTFIMPAYGRVDAMVQYRFRVGAAAMQAQVNVNNIFDKVYYAGVYNDSRDFILPGPPRRALASFRVDF